MTRFTICDTLTIFKMMTPTEIKIELIRNGISGADLARKFGVHRTAIYHILAGRNKTKKLRKAIAQAIKQPYEQVWGNDKNNKRKAA